MQHEPRFCLMLSDGVRRERSRVILAPLSHLWMDLNHLKPSYHPALLIWLLPIPG